MCTAKKNERANHLTRREKKLMTRLIQLKQNDERRVELVEEPRLRLLDGVCSVYQLANKAIADGGGLSHAARECSSENVLDYDFVYSGGSQWRILPPMDHPEEPARCLISGSGQST
jgi:hypothetical protein